MRYGSVEFTSAGRAVRIVDDIHKATKKIEAACRSIGSDMQLDHLQKIDRELDFLCDRLAFHKASIDGHLKR